jgi:outer membrane lipoprotein carrier protein
MPDRMKTIPASPQRALGRPHGSPVSSPRAPFCGLLLKSAQGRGAGSQTEEEQPFPPRGAGSVVRVFLKRILCCVPTVAAVLFGLGIGTAMPGADLPDVPRILKGIEDRYNGTQTLQLSFTESYRMQGRQRVEKGELYLRKPGRMRWQYTSPAGKLFVSDGKFIYSYTPQDNRAEKMKLKEADDMRAPLAFLLGKLHFADDFREFRSRQEDGGVYITAIPKSDKLPYTEVSFLAAPDFSIRRLEVKGQDGSLLQFVFENEKRDPAIQDAMFRFSPPAGAEYIDSSNQ